MARTIYKFLLHLAKVTTSLSFIFGAVVILPYTIKEYFDKQTNYRIEKTLDFFKQFSSPPLISYREKISAAIEKNKERIVKAAGSEKELEKTMIAIVSDENIAANINLLLDFYDSLAVCVVREICDSSTARELFGRRAHEMFTLFYQYIAFQRATTAAREFGLGLETFARRR